jgi:hypothetical protein
MVNEIPQWEPKVTPEQKENIRKWVEYLEVTDLPQTNGTLKNSLGYCCLGIFCEMQKAEWSHYTSGSLEHYELLDTDAQQFRSDVLPTQYATMLGGCNLSVPTGLYGDRDCCSVAELNDTAGLNFKQIASVVRWAYLDGPRPLYPEIELFSE